jgi:hypothetical protein
MPIELSAAVDETIYYCAPDELDGTINFITKEPVDYNGKKYHKQSEYGVVLEDRYRAYETVRRAETGYDSVTDEFITYFLEKLYTLGFKVTGDKTPYSNKAYFTRTKATEAQLNSKDETVFEDYKYTRFYGYVFDTSETYYELDYREFLKGEKELDDNT